MDVVPGGSEAVVSDGGQQTSTAAPSGWRVSAADQGQVEALAIVAFMAVLLVGVLIGYAVGHARRG